MNTTSAVLHRYTPHLQVVDPRRLLTDSVVFCRLKPAEEPQARQSHTAFDVAGRPSMSWDPRLWADRAPANLSVIHSLSGQVLASDSVDAGWRVSLAGEAGQALVVWDARCVVRRFGYDALLRPTEVFEDEHCVERLLYGGPDSTDHNQCGQLIRHDDPAGTRLDDEFGLSGSVISQTRRFLQNLDEPDWPESLTGRDALLEPGEGATTRWRYNSVNETLRQTDAQGNVQFLDYTVAGLLKSSRLQMNGQAEQVLVSAIQYDAQERVVSETAGNGVMSTARYDTEDGRLLALNATRSNGQLLQDLRYDYDPVGNVIRVDDRALPAISKGQRIDSISTYQYDTLYQLIEASGREWAVVNHGPVLPGFQSPADPSTLADYTQTYRYDAGGNLQQLTHTGTQSHSRALVTARCSNRSLPVINGHTPDEAEIAAAFDASGNLLALQAGQHLSWDRRNQLQHVRPVIRENGMDDSERYSYDASGQRLRKVRTTQAKTITHTADVRYLPGLEIRTDTATGETLHVVVAQAGRNNVRVLHWASGKPDALENDQTRYTLNDHLGSGTLELDGQAQRISQESYYPFGGTSWWAGRNAIEANYKTVRYSGKERDATGLYYYGLRYYAPWLQRWINPDPAGAVDGLNVYLFVRNDPCGGSDDGGLVYRGMNDRIDRHYDKTHTIKYRGVSDMRRADEHKLVYTLDLALEESVAVMTREVEKLKAGDTDDLYAFLGMKKNDQKDSSSRLVKKVINGYEKLIKSVARYQDGGDLRDQLVSVEGHPETPNMAAFVVKSDPHRRLFFTDYSRTLNVVSSVQTLIHEVSHLELDTNDDFYYLGFNLKATFSPDFAGGLLIGSVKDAVQKNVDLRASYKPWRHGFKKFETWLSQVADFWGGFAVAQISPKRSLALHKLSIDRFEARGAGRHASNHQRKST
ncbi:RHS repeat domain-containing protein [Pseudomonas syringae group genomosp. 3]|uniref:Insecticidal toxin protein, putative n=1 Tax=Pseudomonas syringae pv. tomato (strain ATCC BAA-871 / DC3000) TaxID=223283 RepID=Q887R0_PSESM|nr:RHS repeat-associated core domain-containing protein [Pseudomonas syringae group genomosp. 3]AAO54756.1 insecticidal toxin protein, putative [Pseudomonas syringae pv. tomato str. DC3000]KKI28033.1 toxin [Pseudomonas syringae pv. persicae]KPB93598.1 Insecticidal toxin protein [Pseudomonas syringae pv. maculicola]KPY93412.1 putative Insecticidal toxin protein [Pseudomonas syringae pv. tomato]